MPTIVIIPQEALKGFTHPALDLQTGQIIELEAKPVQFDLFSEAEQLTLEVLDRTAPLTW